MKRRGTVLLVVLVTVVLLSLGAYSFSERMFSEMKSVDGHGRLVQTRLFSESGIESVAAMLDDRTLVAAEDLFHSPELLHDVLVHDSNFKAARGRFSVIAPVASDPMAATVRFGLMDESAKINLNVLLGLGLDGDQVRNMLLGLPHMTYEIADAILDWIDKDEMPRWYGAENEYYRSLEQPYPAQNGRLNSLRELLLVRGVTPWLLFGEDANRNGLLDPNEDDGDISPPSDNADGVLERGWVAYLTIHSRESNRRANGGERINLNEDSLSELYDRLKARFGVGVARFVAAYRIYGPYNANQENDESFSADRPKPGRHYSFAARMRQHEGLDVRDGLDLSPDTQFQIESLYELIATEVRATVDDKPATLESPWSADPAKLQEYLPRLMDEFSTTLAEFLDGRINIHQAHREVLLGLPGMTEQLANAITASQTIDSTARSSADLAAVRSTTGWLLTDGLVDLDQIRQLDRYITAGGDVHRIQVLGYFDGGGRVARLEAVIDATQQPAKIVFRRDLTDAASN